MGGIFGVVSKEDCVKDLFYGTDYHSHLGTSRGGLAVLVDSGEFERYIHDITKAPFRPKFEDDVQKMKGRKGIGVISDYEPQPMLKNCKLGPFALATVGVVKNLQQLTEEAYEMGHSFSELADGEVNATELVATLISRGASFEEGIQHAQEVIDGSCTLLLLTKKGIYAARDRLGRTPLIIGKKDSACSVTLETCALPNTCFEIEHYLGPGEIALVTEEGWEQLKQPSQKMQICSFLWVYYGFPASHYEGINVEIARNRCGAMLAKRELIDVDMVTGIPDSGTGHAVGYANEKKLPFMKPYVKYTPTWPRSFMPQQQEQRDIVARMKLIPIRELTEGKRILFCDDSIVRGTQLRDNIRTLYKYGAKEVHMRVACPPLGHACEYLNFSRSKSANVLAARIAIRNIEGRDIDEKSDADRKLLEEYLNPFSDRHDSMVEKIRQSIGLSSLKYQLLGDLIRAIGLPKEKLCTHCWDGSSYYR